LSTELESAVLGTIWELGSCTTHAVRVSFLNSASSFWSGSAGSIYPLVKRLETRGLIKGQKRAWGSGSKKVFTITDTGLTALKSWLAAPLPDWVTANHYDAIRTRVFFLGALPPAKRKAFLADAEQKTRLHLAELRIECAALIKADHRFAYFGIRGMVHLLESRLKWFAELSQDMAKQE
jgi:DNA-binding PadR family transcriptional regulator